MSTEGNYQILLEERKVLLGYLDNLLQTLPPRMERLERRPVYEGPDPQKLQSELNKFASRLTGLEKGSLHAMERLGKLEQVADKVHVAEYHRWPNRLIRAIKAIRGKRN